MHGPFKRIPGFSAALCLTRSGGTFADFHSQMLRGLLFLALEAQAREPIVRMGPLIPLGDPHSQDIFHDAQFTWDVDQPVSHLSSLYS